MDRNYIIKITGGRPAAVALRKESVDRNFDAMQIVIVVVKSLSARRAWIEIVYPGTWSGSILVALRKESVDRNSFGLSCADSVSWSLSARRAWIEISPAANCQHRSHQSLSARRAWIEI